MAPIKDLQLTYEAPSAANAFSEGDIITGTVTFTLTQQTKVKSLQVKVKGGASVWWKEDIGLTEIAYSDHKEFFEVKEYLVAENPKGRPMQSVAEVICFSLLTPGQDDFVYQLFGSHFLKKSRHDDVMHLTYFSGTVLARGRHRYHFKLKIPHGQVALVVAITASQYLISQLTGNVDCLCLTGTCPHPSMETTDGSPTNFRPSSPRAGVLSEQQKFSRFCRGLRHNLTVYV